MTFSRDYLEAAHKRCIFNKDEILKSHECGCFYCLSIFTPDKIEEWIDDEPEIQTALCPKCAIDSVIGDASGYPVNEHDFLWEMKRVYFL